MASRRAAQSAQESLTAGRRDVLGAGVVSTDPVAVLEPVRLVLAVPWPPSTNHLYATVNGRRVKTAEARDYADAVGVRVKIAHVRAGGWPMRPYRLLLTAFPPDARRRDVSNLVKCLEDSIFGAMRADDPKADDCDVTYLRAIKRTVDRRYPRVEVVLEHDDGEEARNER